MNWSDAYQNLLKALNGLRVLASTWRGIEGQLVEMQPDLVRMRYRSEESAQNLEKLARRVRNLILVPNDHSEERTQQLALVLETLENSIKISRTLIQGIDDFSSKHQDVVDRQQEQIGDAPYYLAERLANTLQQMEPSTLPMLAATSQSILGDIMDKVLSSEHGRDTLRQVLRDDPEYLERLVELTANLDAEDEV